MAMSPVMPASCVTDSTTGSKRLGVIGEGGCEIVNGWQWWLASCMVNWWGGMVSAGWSDRSEEIHLYVLTPHPLSLSQLFLPTCYAVEDGGEGGRGLAMIVQKLSHTASMFT